MAWLRLCGCLLKSPMNLSICGTDQSGILQVFEKISVINCSLSWKISIQSVIQNIYELGQIITLLLRVSP